MRRITQEELNKILELHQKWLDDDPDGVRADLSYADLTLADLSGVDLKGADLSYADLIDVDLKGVDLRGADLSYADLRYTNLRGVDLFDANLKGVDLRFADLRDTDLSSADLRFADLRDADLFGADLRDANLRGADLENVKTNENTSFFALQCPEEGSFIGYKKADGKIVVLQITEDAKRSSGTSRKCRCSKAKVLRIEDIEGNILNIESVESDYDESFIYTVEGIVEVKDFDNDRWNECSTGIHFFMTKQEAVNYN